jgi:hypothetical protein
MALLIFFFIHLFDSTFILFLLQSLRPTLTISSSAAQSMGCRAVSGFEPGTASQQPGELTTEPRRTLTITPHPQLIHAAP